MRPSFPYRLALTWRLCTGWFLTDPQDAWPLRAVELLSRFTWQLPQCLAGFLYGLGAIWVGKVRTVRRFAGATAICGSGTPRGSASLGCFLQLRPFTKGRETAVGLGRGSYLFMHEYGHYRQSRLWGPLYLPLIGLPSALGAHWTELDANRRSARYLKRRFNFDWHEGYFSADSPRSLYCRLK
jgi:hypothetical protein